MPPPDSCQVAPGSSDLPPFYDEATRIVEEYAFRAARSIARSKPPEPHSFERIKSELKGLCSAVAKRLSDRFEGNRIVIDETLYVKFGGVALLGEQNEPLEDQIFRAFVLSLNRMDLREPNGHEDYKRVLRTFFERLYPLSLEENLDQLISFVLSKAKALKTQEDLEYLDYLPRLREKVECLTFITHVLPTPIEDVATSLAS